MRIGDAWTWLLAGSAGAALGAFFFGGLWWTVRTVGSRRSPLWLAGGLVLRMAVTLLGFHAVGAGHWQRLLACLAGFIVARSIALRVAGPAGATRPTDVRKATHAP